MGRRYDGDKMRQVHGSAPGGTGIPPPCFPRGAEAWWSRVRLRQNRAQSQPGGPWTTGLARCMGPDRGTARKRHPLPVGKRVPGMIYSSARALASSMAFCWAAGGQSSPPWSSMAGTLGEKTRGGVDPPRENSPLRCEFAAQKRRAGAARLTRTARKRHPLPAGNGCPG